LVSLRLPHLASTSTLLSKDLTMEELGLTPRATLIASTLNDDERTQTLQKVLPPPPLVLLIGSQSRVVVVGEIETAMSDYHSFGFRSRS
jgi:hypothetical protein